MLEAAEAKHSEACVAIAKLEDEHRCCDVTIGEKTLRITELETELASIESVVTELRPADQM